MTRFTIDSEGKVTALESGAGVQPKVISGAEIFSGRHEFAKSARNWPLARLVAIWNGLPGITPVRRFTDRKTAVARIWKAINPAGRANALRVHSGKRVHRGRNEAVVHKGSKKARIVAMLSRRKGATLHHIMRATGWQAHSVRGFISGNLVKRMGLQINSSRRANRERSYRVVKG